MLTLVYSRRPFLLFLLVITFAFPLVLGAQEMQGTDQENAIDFDRIQAELVFECPLLDVVILIDQSYSMNNSDPEDFRITATGSLLEILFNNAAYQCAGLARHRVAVLGFSSQTVVILPRSEIFVEPGDLSWQDTLDDWIDTIELETSNPDGDTAIYEAMLGEKDSINSVLAEWVAEDNSEQISDKIAIIVSDGAPCSPRAYDLPGRANPEVLRCDEPEYVNHYLTGDNNAYQPFVTEENFVAEGFPSQRGLISDVNRTLGRDVQINILLFGKQDGLDAFGGIGEAFDTIAQFSGGQYFRPNIDIDASRLSDIDAVMAEIVRPVLNLGTQVNACRLKFYLEPYRSSTTIISSVRPNNDSELQIITPNGVINAQNFPSNVAYRFNDSRETFIFQSPTPGEYQLDGDPFLCDNLRATVSESNVVPEISPIDAVPVSFIETPTEGVRARLQLRNRSDNKPFAEIPNFPLHICGKLTATELEHSQLEIDQVNAGLSSTCINFEPSSNPDEIGTWISDPLPAPRQGKYKLEVAGFVTTVQPDSNLQVPVFLAQGEYITQDEVGVRLVPVEPSVVSSPENGDIFQLNRIDTDQEGAPSQSANPLDVQVRFETTDGVPLSLEDVFPNVTQATPLVEVTITQNSSGVTDTVTLGLEDKVNGADGVLSAKLLDDNEGTSTLYPQGEYTLTFKLTEDGQGSYNKENFAVSSTDSVATTYIRALELTGVLLLPNEMSNQFDLNTVNPSTGKHENATIEPISVVMVDQENTPIDLVDVFGTEVDPNNLVFVQLYHNDQPKGIPTPLQREGETYVFSGQLKRELLPVDDVTGEYELRFTINFSDEQLSEEKQLEYTLVHSAANEIVSKLPVNLQLITGIRVALGNGGVQDSSRYPLNSVTSEGIQEPESLILQAQLLQSDQEVPFETPEQTANYTTGLIVFDLTGPDIQLTDVPMEHQGGGLYQYRFDGKLSTTQPTRLIDQPGDYTVVFKPSNISIHNNYIYLLDPVTITFVRYEKRGIRLDVTEFGGVDASLPISTSDVPVDVPMYASWWDAMGNDPLPLGAKPKDVRFCLVAKDTNDEPVPLESLVRQGTSVGDANNPNAIAWTALIPLQVIRQDTATEIPIKDISSDGNGKLCGMIDGASTKDGGTFTFSYRIDDAGANYIDDETIYILDQGGATITFERKITTFWLNPQFWIPIEWILCGIVGLFVLRWFWINFISPMRSVAKSINVEYNLNVVLDEQNRVERIFIRRWFGVWQVQPHRPFSRSQTGKPDNPLSIRVTIRKVPFQKAVQVQVEARDDKKKAWVTKATCPSLSKDKPKYTSSGIRIYIE